VGNWRKENADDLEDGIFANNPFLDDLLEWRHSPEGQQFAEFADALCDLMEDVQLDAKQRKFIWPDAQRLDLDQSVAHVQKQYPDFRQDWIEEYLIDWIDMDYAPEHYSEAQLDELTSLLRDGSLTISAAPRPRKDTGELVTLELTNRCIMWPSAGLTRPTPLRQVRARRATLIVEVPSLLARTAGRDLVGPIEQLGAP
jgi:hypothetical protein